MADQPIILTYLSSAVNSRFKKLRFSFLKSRVVWFKKDLLYEPKNQASERNTLCRWICKLRSLLNRVFTVFNFYKRTGWRKRTSELIIFRINISYYVVKILFQKGILQNVVFMPSWPIFLRIYSCAFMDIGYRIPSYSFRGNYSFLNLALCIGHST